MKLTLKLNGITAVHVNFLLLLCIAISFYGPINVRKGNLATTTSSNIDNANELGNYAWDGLEYTAGGVTQTLMYADTEECDDQDNNDNGINMMCSKCNSAGRTIAGASSVSMAFLGLGTAFGALRVAGLDTVLRPDSAAGPGLIFYEISSHLVATSVMTLGVFMWGTQCLAQIQGRDNNVQASGFNMAIVSAAFMGLTTYLSTFIKRKPNLWRVRNPVSGEKQVGEASKGGTMVLGPTSSSVALDVNETTSSATSSPQLTTSTFSGRGPPTRGPPSRGPPSRGPPSRGPPKSRPPPPRR